MRFVIIFLIAMAVSPVAWSGGYQIFEENGKVGIKNESGQVVLAAAFEALGWSDGSFSVVGQVTGYRSKGLWGLLNLKKEFLTKAEYDQFVYTGGDRIIASRKINSFTVKQGCIHLTGRVTVPFQYDGIKINGLRAIVFNKNGARFEHGLIDLDDKTILALKYKNIQSLGSLRYAVQNFDNKIALFTESGIKLTDFTIDSLSDFKKGWAILYQNFKQGLLNREGEIKAEPVYREVKINEDGTVKLNTPYSWKIIDENNRQLEEFEADELTATASGYRMVKSGKIGTLDKQFKVIIPARYDYLGPFIQGKAAAKKEGKFGVLRANGSVALPFLFDSLAMDERGRLIRIKDKTAGVISWQLFDTLGVQKSQAHYDFIDRYNGTVFPVSNRGYYGGMDVYGKEIIHCVYDSLIQAKEGRVIVKFKGQYGIISLEENWLLKPQPYPLTIINADLYLEKQPTITFLKNLNGEIVYFTSNKLTVKDGALIEAFADGAMQKVSFEGRIVKPANVLMEVEKVFPESEGMRGIKRDGKYGFIDTQGRLRVANRYEAIGQFKEGLASVKILGKWGYVNIWDQIIINPSYEEANEFLSGTAIIKRAGKFGLTDLAGKIILPLRYDGVERMKNKFIITLNHLKGIADEKGTVLIEPRFQRLEVLENDQVIVGDSNKYGVLSIHGMSIVPIVYDELFFVKERNSYLALKKSEWKNF
ncbi:MAG: hypothetical protein DI538_03855 [Azospira oryzae]|nr:MAG: hypothetical protein DI538_03855 [Azospira oryzae]